MIIADYKSTTLRTSPSISAARTVSNGNYGRLNLRTTLPHLQALTVLHQHYVGTLGKSVVVNLPRLLNFFFKGVSPFMDPAARDEVRLSFPTLIE